MLDFKEVCKAPTICLSCNTFAVRNWFSKRVRCSHCGKKLVFYNDPSLQADPSAKGTVFAWNTPRGEFLLPATLYLCPQCGKKKMRFQDVGCWD